MLYAAYQLRGYCTRRGYHELDRVLDLLCDLGNTCIQQRSESWADNSTRVGFNDQSKLLTEIRTAVPAWKAIGVNVARSALRRVDTAFNAFYRRCKAGEKPGYPRYKPHHRYDCIDISDVTPAEVKRRCYGLRVKLKGLPAIWVKPHRELPDGLPKQIRIVRRATGCTVDLVYPVEAKPLPVAGRVTGVDLGVRKRLTLSSGETITPERETDWRAIRRSQRSVSRCKRGSRRRRKRTLTLRRQRRREAVRRRNTCHRITTRLVRDHDLIAVEKLRIKNMTAAGRYKTGLNRTILEQGWGLILSQLRYKAERAGRQFREVDPAYTSRDCHVCGARGDPGRSEYWTCAACGSRHDRDVNAARNILNRAGSTALESVTAASVGAVDSEILS